MTLALEVRIARSKAESDPATAAPFLERLGQELSEASAELRELARGIHPAVLTERGLGPAIAALTARAPVPVEVLELPDYRLDSVVETTAYFTVSEALTNVAKYAHASRASVRLAHEGDELVVEVRDDGVGGARASTGSGLSGLADRLGACDGRSRGPRARRARERSSALCCRSRTAPGRRIEAAHTSSHIPNTWRAATRHSRPSAGEITESRISGA